MDVMEDERFVTIDSLPFVKVYSDEYGRCIYGLPYVGFQLLSYVMMKVERNSNLKKFKLPYRAEDDTLLDPNMIAINFGS